MEQRPLIKAFTAASSDFVKAMASGEGDLGFCPSPGICYRIKDAGGADFGFVFPKEGTTGWVDGNMLVKGPPTATRRSSGSTRSGRRRARPRWP
jgi:spermidine/putrescine-binding protein